MSTPFPKSKEKRPRSSSEPNKSFVKNVTSKVSGLLPATIAKWFSSPSSSSTNGSAQVADATDSSTEDEAPESPITTQPPAKKIRYSSPGEFIQHVQVETRCASTNTESIDDIYTALSPIGRNTTRRETIFTSTRVHSANDNTTEETTQENLLKPQHSLSTIEKSMTNRRKSLFGAPPQDNLYKKHSQSKSGNIRDPDFKPSLLSSPFYVGRNMYGGATSSSLAPSTFKKKTISLTNETSNSDSVTMSHSARCVMDLLEHYSSPLIEAKRIPQIARTQKQDPNNSIQQSVNPYGPKGYSYKTQELYVPKVASILTIKRKSRLMDTTSAARQIIASHSSSSEFLPYPRINTGGDALDEASGNKLTTKVKSRLTRTNRERNVEVENITSDIVKLPNVVLKIDKDNLPKFTFGPISNTQPPQSSSIQTPVIITPEALKKSTESDKSDITKVKNVERDNPLQVNNNNDYTFSRPVQISSESNTISFTLPKYSVGSFERNTEKAKEVKTKDDQLPVNVGNKIGFDNKLSVPKRSDWRCSDCWVMNSIELEKCACCGGKKPVEVDEPYLKQEGNATKWACSNCWINNNESAEKCVCCGETNPKKTTKVFNTDKIVEDEWKCNACWIKNKSSLVKCAACGGQKPGFETIGYNNFGKNNKALLKDSQEDSMVKETSDNTFKNIAKSQSERWECPLCLVRNESSRDTCICCEANKPGTEKESHTKFNFHQPSEITFKFGIQPIKNQETCTDIEPEECIMGEESETNNNILPKTLTFNFGLPVKKLDDRSESMDKSVEPPKMNFTFGVSTEDQMSPVRNTIFGMPNNDIFGMPKIVLKPNKIIEEKPQEVPQVFTVPQSNEPSNNNLGLFNTPVTSQVASEMPALVPLHQVNQNKNDTSFLSSSSIVPSVSSETKTKQNNFTFPSIMPATNLFSSTPTTTTTISNMLSVPSMSIPTSSTMSIFQKANVVTTTTSSFFQKSDTVPTLGVSLFSKTESTPTATTSSLSIGSMQPVFSFGGQGSAPQAEKPKFSFNFMSNKTDPGTVFNPPTFGVSTDNNISNNNFNLPSNSIIGGNALSGNPLNNTTQMNTSQALTTGNSLTTPSGSSIFGAAVPKENMWSSNTTNMFSTNTTTNGDPKPPAFTFGAATPFSANNTPFGNNTQQGQQNQIPFGSSTQQAQQISDPFGTTQQVQPNNVPFGSTIQQAPPNNAPFGGTAQQAQSNQPPQNVFGIGSPTTTSQPSMFGNNLQNQPTQNIFGSLQVPNNPMPMGMFGAPNPVIAPSFGTLNPPIPTFETSLAPAQTAPPSFNFGGQQPTGIFGFGQVQQPGQLPSQPEGQPGMYGFGGPTGPAPQFTIGSAPNTAPNTAVRRVRKAIRRTQR